MILSGSGKWITIWSGTVYGLIPKPETIYSFLKLQCDGIRRINLNNLSKKNDKRSNASFENPWDDFGGVYWSPIC